MSAGEIIDVVDEDGTVHVPAQSVPPSKFLSPQGKAYLAEHLKKVRQPQLLQQDQDNGIPPLIAGYLDRQRILFASSLIKSIDCCPVCAALLSPHDEN